jgi:hypothetical protein
MDHEVLDCARMIAKLEEMNMRQENPKADLEIVEPQKDSEKVWLQIKETLTCHIIKDLQRKRIPLSNNKRL